MSATRMMAGLRAQNTKLKNRVADLQNAADLRSAQMKNSLSGLIDGAYAQTNLTSFNPIIQNNIYAPLTINWMMLAYMYKTHGLIQTAIDVPVLDALRGGLDFQSGELDKDNLKDLQDFLVRPGDDYSDEGVLDTVAEAMTWARLFGGAALIVNTDQDPVTPLVDTKFGRLAFYAATRWELIAPHKFSEFYTFYGKRIHRSRVITLSGKTAPSPLRWQLHGWGMSAVERMVEDFNSYLRTNNVIYELLEEAKVDVYRMEGFKTSLATEAGTQIIQRRIELSHKLKDFNNALLLDKEDEYEQKQLTFAGLAEMKKIIHMGIASALRIPMTKLFGISASGFNSGEDDIENYNAMVESEVREPLRRPIRQVLRLACLHLFGAEYDIDFSFKPLRVMSSVDEENVKTSKQNRMMQLYDHALLDSVEVGELLEKEKLITIETKAAAGLLDEHPVTPAEEAAMEKDGPGGPGAPKDKKGGPEK